MLRPHCRACQDPQCRGARGGRLPGRDAGAQRRAHMPSSLPRVRLPQRLGRGAAGSVRLHLCSGATLRTKLARGRITAFSRPRTLLTLHTGPGGWKPVCGVDGAPHGSIKTAQRRGRGPDRDGTWISSRRNKISLCVRKGSQAASSVGEPAREGAEVWPRCPLCVS